MPSTLVIGGVVFQDALAQLPPQPSISPPARRTSILESISTSPEVIIFSGTSASFPVRFASAENLGYVTNQMKNDLIALYLTGNTFELKTDLLGVRNVEQTFNGVYFDPSSVPVFAPHAVPSGDHYNFELILRVPYA